tara:strand:+ start:1121 stop:1687 length:567 start_codon:yes stop_codon:yes gene_type:complete
MTTVYGLYHTGKEAPKIEVFASAEIARSSGNGFSIVEKQSCLNDVRRFPTSLLIDIYNINAERKVSRFRDRATAESRVWKMLTEQEAPQEQTPQEQTEAPKEVSKKPKKLHNGGYNNSKRFANRRIISKVTSNPRTKKTGYGYNSMEIVINAGESGILYEEYIRLGGRDVDLRWDLDRENVFVTPSEK